MKVRVMRRPELAVFVAAFVARLSAGVMVALTNIQYRLAPDAYGYELLMEQRMRGNPEYFRDYSQQLYDSSWSFLKPIEWVVWSPWQITPAAILFTALAGAVLAALTTRLLLAYVSPLAALTGGLVVAFMPSQVVWSSMLLKDAYIGAAIAGLALTLRWWCAQRSTPRLVAGLALVAALLLYISRIRVPTLVAVLIGLVLALVIAAPSRRAIRATGAVALLFVIPITAGAGIAGRDVLSRLDSGMEWQRVAGAIDAATAVVTVPTTTPRQPGQATTPSTTQPGQATTPSTTQPSPPITPPPPPERPALVDDLLYLPSGVKVMTLDPMPWHLSASRSLIPAFAEHLIWYPLLALAAVGILTRRRWTIDLVFTGLLLAGLIVMWALAEGNFGTAYRHRTEFVWIVVVFAVLGADELRRRRDLRRHPTTTSTTTPINA